MYTGGNYDACGSIRLAKAGHHAGLGVRRLHLSILARVGQEIPQPSDAECADMTLLETVLFGAMVGGLALIWRGLYWFDRSYGARQRGMFVLHQRQLAGTYDNTGLLYNILGVILLLPGGIYFRLMGT